jgi:hypothetical protein
VAHASAHTAADAGNPHSNSTAHSAPAHAAVTSHASGASVLFPILNGGTKLLAGIVALVAIELPGAAQGRLRSGSRRRGGLGLIGGLSSTMGSGNEEHESGREAQSYPQVTHFSILYFPDRGHFL